MSQNTFQDRLKSIFDQIDFDVFEDKLNPRCLANFLATNNFSDDPSLKPAANPIALIEFLSELEKQGFSLCWLISGIGSQKNICEKYSADRSRINSIITALTFANVIWPAIIISLESQKVSLCHDIETIQEVLNGITKALYDAKELEHSIIYGVEH